MCGVWTQEQWRERASKPGSQHSLVTEKANADGNTALIVREKYTFSSETVYWTIYSADGRDYGFHNLLREAREALAFRGYTQPVGKRVQGKEIAAITVDEATELPRTTYEQMIDAAIEDEAKTEPLPEPEPAPTTLEQIEHEVRVQGRTLAEWFREGQLNSDRDVHVHPIHPEGRPSTEEETQAFINSLSLEEAVVMLLSSGEQAQEAVNETRVVA